MVVEFGNFYYFLYIFLAIAFIACLYFWLRNKSEKTQRWVLFGILAFNFILHFAKQAFPGYELPGSFHKSTLENICAVSTVLFPFLFMIPKRNIVHDYVYFIGFMGGFFALVYPTEALGEHPFIFESVRFYICHISLIAVPLVSAMIGLHVPGLKNAWSIPLFFYVHEAIIMLNEIVLQKTGLIKISDGMTAIQFFLDREKRNNSFIHGPTPDMDGVGEFLTFFCPKIFTKDIFGVNGGIDFYWPIIWMVIPVIIYFIPIYLLVAAPVSEDLRNLIRRKKENKIPKSIELL